MVRKDPPEKKVQPGPEAAAKGLKQVKKILRKEPDRAQQYLDIAGVIFVCLAPDQSITMINRKGCELLGYPQDALIGKNWFDVILPENERAEIKALFARLIRGELEPIEYVENHVVTRAGEKRLISWHNTLVRDTEGNITGSLSSGEDITGRRQAETVLQESERRLREIVENSQAGYFFVDREGRYRQVNNAWLRMHGYDSPEEVIGKHLSVTQVKADYQAAQRNVEFLLAGNPIPSGEFTRRCKDGSVGYHTFSAHPVFQTGKVIGIEGFIIDTTSVKQYEESLLHATQLNKEVISSIQEGLTVYDRQLCYVLWNPFMEALTGVPARDVLGKFSLDVFPHLREQGVDRLLERALAGETVRSPDTKFYSPTTGLSGWVVGTYAPHRNADGEIIGVIGAIRDITYRKLEQERKDLALRITDLLNVTAKEKELIGAILSLIQDFSGCEAVGIRLRQGDDYPYYEARGFVPGFIELEDKLCGYDENGQVIRDFQGNPVLDCMCGNIIQGRFDPSKPFFTLGGSFWSNCTTELLASTTDEDRQARTRNRCNGEGYESVALIPLKGGGGNIGLLQLNDTRRNRFTPDLIEFYEGLATSIGIVIARRWSQQALSSSEEKFRMLYENAPTLIDGFDNKGRCVLWNKECQKVFGWTLDEINSHAEPLALFYPDPEIRKEVIASVTSQPDQVFREWHPLTREGKELTVLWANFRLPGGEVINIGHDITESKILEEEQQKVARLESIGLLAAGIAHNFNNLLTVILGNIDVAKLDAKPDSETRDVLDEAEKASLQAKDLTAQLLTFSRGGEPVRKMASLAELLKSTAESTLRGSNVRCRFSIPSDLRQAEIDPVQVSQVIHNVVLNAQQAMPDGGTIQLAAENLTAGNKQDPENEQFFKSGDYIRITVTDQGSGIPEQYMKKIFDPFFTTKTKAVGLGLSTAYSIVRRHGGRISLDSKAGGGLTVSICLPVARENGAKT